MWSNECRDIWGLRVEYNGDTTMQVYESGGQEEIDLEALKMSGSLQKQVDNKNK